MHEALVTGDGGTAVLTVGFQGEALYREQRDVAAFAAAPSRDDVERFVEAASRVVADGDHAVAVYAADLPDSAPRAIETARSALDTDRLAAYATELPPLAGTVLTSLAAAIAPRAPSPAALVAALPALERELFVLSWLGSVTGLKRPAPSVAQHAVSMWPSTNFAVTLQPEPSVKRLTKKDSSAPLPEDLERPLALAVSGHLEDVRWVEQVVVPALHHPPVTKLHPRERAASWWGTASVVEAVTHPLDLERVAERVFGGLELRGCAWCERQVASEPCPFCGMSTGEEAAQPEPPKPAAAAAAEEKAEDEEPDPVAVLGGLS